MGNGISKFVRNMSESLDERSVGGDAKIGQDFEFSGCCKGDVDDVDVPSIQAVLSRSIKEFEKAHEELIDSKEAERNEKIDRELRIERVADESVGALHRLVESGNVLLDRIDARESREKKSSGTQIRVAVWTLVISVAVSVISLCVSVCSYYHSRNVAVADSVWQERMLEAFSRNGEGARESLNKPPI